MIDRRTFLLAGVGGALMALPAWAEDYVAQIVRQLEKRGYRDITVTRTLLGRVRIVAISNRGTREIILNPSTGEILRDLTTGNGKGSNGGEILGDDDDDDDDDDGGNTGHGGGGGGHGGGGDDDDDDDDDDN